MLDPARCGAPGSVMENWDVSEWMQVGIKLPHCPWSRALCLSFPCGYSSSLCPGGLELLGEIWENFQPRYCWQELIVIPHPCPFPSLLKRDRGVRDGGRAGITARSSFWPGWSSGFGYLNSLLMGWWWIYAEEWGFIPGIPVGSGILSSIIPVAPVAVAIPV